MPPTFNSCATSCHGSQSSANNSLSFMPLCIYGSYVGYRKRTLNLLQALESGGGHFLLAEGQPQGPHARLFAAVGSSLVRRLKVCIGHPYSVVPACSISTLYGDSSSAVPLRSICFTFMFLNSTWRKFSMVSASSEGYEGFRTLLCSQRLHVASWYVDNPKMPPFRRSYMPNSPR